VTASAPALVAVVGPSPVSTATAVVAQPTPTPSQEPLTPLTVSPGLAGFIPVFLIALASIVLFLSLTRHLRRVTVRQAEIDATEREREGRDGPSGEAGPDDRGPGTP